MGEAWGVGKRDRVREGQRRETLNPIISPQPLVKTASRKFMKSFPTVTLWPEELEGHAFNPQRKATTQGKLKRLLQSISLQLFLD